MGKGFGLVVLSCALTAAFAGAPPRAEDCNRNGLDDERDLAPEVTGFDPGVGVARGALAIAAGDIDLDGDRDLLVAGEWSYGAWVLVNTGGKLSPAKQLAPSLSGNRLLLGDMDADGRLDLVTSSRGGPTAISVYRQLEDGTFSDVPVSGQVVGLASAVALGDLDSDGDLDLVVGEANGTSLLVLFRNKGRELSAETLARVSFPMDVALADLDGDGDLDAALAAPFEAVVLRLEDGLPAADPVGMPIGAGPRSIRAGDLDGDGDVDLVTANQLNPGNISVIANAGDGVFALPRNYAMGLELGNLELADADGDGDLDAFVQAFGSAGFFVALNDGGAGFLDVRGYSHPGSLVHTAVTDLENDGLPDFCVIDDRASAIFTLKNDGGGTFHWSPPPSRDPDFFSVGRSIQDLACVDIDADGDKDVAFARYGGLPGALLNGGARSFSVAEDFQLDFPLATRVITADLDGRFGEDMVLAAFGRREIALALHREGLQFEVEKRTLEEGPSCLDAGDLDRDGHMDVVVAGYFPGTFEGVCRVLLNDGAGGVRKELSFPTELQPLDLRVSDLDGDGAPDVLVAPREIKAAVIHWGKGDGGLEPAKLYPSRAGAPAIIEDGDFDGDGPTDFAAFCSSCSALHLYRNEGGRIFNDLQVFTTPDRQARALAAMDLDADGLRELAVLYIDGGTFFFRWREGRLEPSVEIFTPRGVVALKGSDMDGDGAMDLVSGLRNTAQTISIAWNEAARPFSEDQDRDGTPDECRFDMPYRRGDAVGEGLLDLTDPMAILRTLFLGAPAPVCLDAADADGDGRISVADAISLLLYLFQDGPTPPAPGPWSCGRDPHPPGSPRRLGCESYESCR